MKGLGLTSEAASSLRNELKERLEPAIIALEADPSRELPQLRPVRVALSGQAKLELTTREGLDLYFALKQLLDECATGTAEHTHIYAEDYGDEFPVWIDPDSTLRASIL